MYKNRVVLLCIKPFNSKAVKREKGRIGYQEIVVMSAEAERLILKGI